MQGHAQPIVIGYSCFSFRDLHFLDREQAVGNQCVEMWVPPHPRMVGIPSWHAWGMPSPQSGKRRIVPRGTATVVLRRRMAGA